MGRTLVALAIFGAALLASVAGSPAASAASYSYVELEPGTPTASSGANATAATTTFAIPVFALYEPGGGPTNSTATEEIAYDLSVLFVGQGTSPLVNWTLSNVVAGSFELTLVLSASQVSAVEHGDALVSLNATLQAEAGGTLAASGTIGAATLSAAIAPPTWWEIWFGASTPPPNTDSLYGVLQFLAWMDGTTTGRALYMLTTLVAVSLYLWEGHKLARARVAAKPSGAS